MNRTLTCATMFFAFAVGMAQTTASSSTAPQEPSGSAQRGSNSAMPADTSIDATLSSTLDAKRAKPGDPVTAKTNSDVRQGSKVLIRKGSKLTGHVTEATARTKDTPQSKLGMIFDKAVDHGNEIPISAVMQAVIAPASSDDAIMPGAPSGGQTQTLGAAGGSSTIGGSSGSKVTAARGLGTNGGNLIPNSPDDSNRSSGPASGQVMESGSDRVINLPGVSLQAVGGGAIGTNLVSNTHNIRIESGSRLILGTTGRAPTAK